MTTALFPGMDIHGMYPDWFFCTGCGKQLNADGNHPAELYAGTFNGLCYGCTGRGAYVAKVCALDGAREVSWPPHCPSWRRDRETFIAYADCEACGGLGVDGHGSSHGGGTYPLSCKPCLDRCIAHPVRVWDEARRKLIYERAQAAFERAWDQAAGSAGKCTKKRRTELREAYIELLGEERWKAFKVPFRDRAGRLRERQEAAARQRGLVWSLPPEVAARIAEAERLATARLQAAAEAVSG